MVATNGNSPNSESTKPITERRKTAGDSLLSEDWNALINELNRLGNDKVNREGDETLIGSLTIQKDSSAPADSLLNVNGNLSVTGTIAGTDESGLKMLGPLTIQKSSSDDKKPSLTVSGDLSVTGTIIGKNGLQVAGEISAYSADSKQPSSLIYKSSLFHQWKVNEKNLMELDQSGRLNIYDSINITMPSQIPDYGIKLQSSIAGKNPSIRINNAEVVFPEFTKDNPSTPDDQVGGIKTVILHPNGTIKAQHVYDAVAWYEPDDFASWLTSWKEWVLWVKQTASAGDIVAVVTAGLNTIWNPANSPEAEHNSLLRQIGEQTQAVRSEAEKIAVPFLQEIGSETPLSGQDPFDANQYSYCLLFMYGCSSVIEKIELDQDPGAVIDLTYNELLRKINPPSKVGLSVNGSAEIGSSEPGASLTISGELKLYGALELFNDLQITGELSQYTDDSQKPDSLVYSSPLHHKWKINRKDLMKLDSSGRLSLYDRLSDEREKPIFMDYSVSLLSNIAGYHPSIHVNGRELYLDSLTKPDPSMSDNDVGGIKSVILDLDGAIKSQKVYGAPVFGELRSSSAWLNYWNNWAEWVENTASDGDLVALVTAGLISDFDSNAESRAALLLRDIGATKLFSKFHFISPSRCSYALAFIYRYSSAIEKVALNTNIDGSASVTVPRLGFWKSRSSNKTRLAVDGAITVNGNLKTENIEIPVELRWDRQTTFSYKIVVGPVPPSDPKLFEVWVGDVRTKASNSFWKENMKKYGFDYTPDIKVEEAEFGQRYFRYPPDIIYKKHETLEQGMKIWWDCVVEFDHKTQFQGMQVWSFNVEPRARSNKIEVEFIYPLEELPVTTEFKLIKVRMPLNTASRSQKEVFGT